MNAVMSGEMFCVAMDLRITALLLVSICWPGDVEQLDLAEVTGICVVEGEGDRLTIGVPWQTMFSWATVGQSVGWLQNRAAIFGERVRSH